MIIPRRVYDRAVSNVAAGPNDCLTSNYSTGSHGYAQIGWQESGVRRVSLVHLVVWRYVNGLIPDGMTVDHVCKNKLCANIRHMRLLSNFENARRTSGKDWPLGQCARGHSNKNLIERKDGGRVRKRCLLCEREDGSKWRKRKRHPA